MKIYKRIVIDMESGRTVAAESFDYSGPVALAKTQKSETKVVVPPPTEEENQAKQLANQISLLNLRQLGYDAKWVVDAPEEKDRKGKVTRAATGHWDITERAQTPEEIERKRKDDELEKLIYDKLTATDGGITDETRRLVGDTFESQRQSGNEELTRYLREQAAARGLDINDTPLLREIGIQKGRLETGLRGAEAASLLDVGQRQQVFAQALREFQTNLQQQAFLNRAGIGESASQTALGLGRLRSQNVTQTQTQSGGGGLFGQIIGGAGAAGGLMQGLGALGVSLSSMSFKDNIEPADIEAILAELEATPVYTWNYKPEFNDPRRHVGPVTERAPRAIVTEDGKALVYQDVMGFLFAALKALSEKVTRLENARSV